MNKKTKMWVGVAVVAAAAYYFWNKSKTTPALTSTTETKKLVGQDGTSKFYSNQKMKNQDGTGMLPVGSKQKL